MKNINFLSCTVALFFFSFSIVAQVSENTVVSRKIKKASVLYSNAEIDSAKLIYSELTEIPTINSTVNIVSSAYEALSTIANNEGDFKAAVEYSKKGLYVIDNSNPNILPTTHFDLHEELIIALIGQKKISEASRKLADLDSISSIYEQSISSRQIRRARVLLLDGKIKRSQTEYESAILLISKCIEMLELVDTINVDSWKFDAYNERGLSYFYLGSFEEGLSDFQTMKTLSNNTSPIDFLNMSSVYNNIGLSLWRIGKYYYRNSQNDTGESFFKEADSFFGLAIKIKGQASPESRDLSRMINNSGMTHDDRFIYAQDTVAYKLAHDIYLNSLLMKKRILHENDPFITRSYMNIGALYMENNDYNNALLNLQKGIALQTRDFEGEDINSLPNLLQTVDKLRVLYCLKKKAEVYRRRFKNKTHDISDLELSFNHFELSLQLISLINSEYNDSEPKMRFSSAEHETIGDFLNVALLLHSKTNDSSILNRALSSVEFLKAYVLKSVAIEKDILTNYTADEHLSKRVKSLSEDMRSIEISMFDKELKSISDSTLLRYNFLKEEFASLISRVENDIPQSKIRLLAKERINEFNQEWFLEHPNSLLINYIESGSKKFVFTITKSSISLDTLSAYNESDVLKFISFVNNSDDSKYNNQLEEFMELGNNLFNILIEPSIKYNINPSKIIIIPDGDLYNLPFEALLSEKSDKSNYIDLPYLIKKYPISYANSLALLSSTTSSKNNTYRGDLAILAPDHKSNPLSRAKEESIDLQESYGASRISSITEVYSSLEDGSNYSALHIATHGVVNLDTIEKSYLTLPNPDDANSEHLAIRDIEKLPLDIEMVFLASCETSVGEAKKGEGVISIARAFFLAGSKSVITSLWKINDQSTSLITKEFYRHLEVGESKDVALQKAKLEYIDQGNVNSSNWSHPFYWASVIGYGNMNELKLDDETNIWLYTSLLGFILLVGFIGRKYFINIKD